MVSDTLIHVDRVGVPLATQIPSCALVLGVPEGAQQRLRQAGVEEFRTALSEAADADVVIVSTRVPRVELAQLLTSLRDLISCPVIGLTHTGGEAGAVDIMRGGAAAILAEGNEGALGAALAGTANDTSLVEIYDRQASTRHAREDAARSRDEVTGLPRETSFVQRLADCEQTGLVPRIGFVRVLHLAEAAQRLSPAATSLLRRRLALHFRELANQAGVELFVMGTVDFALLSEKLEVEEAEALGRAMARIVETFAPGGHQALALALGHAGPEVTTELATLRELAQRALTAAAAERASTVVSAETLALGVSSNTELEAAYRLLGFVEQHSGCRPGHGANVAFLAGKLSWELGYEGLQRARIQVAAHLHDIGLAGLPIETMNEQGLTGNLLHTYRSHPIRGADYLRVSAGHEVADVVRSHHERWDGRGFPDGLVADAIPLGARIVAVASAFERLRRGLPTGLPLGAALSRLTEFGGTALDPSIIGVAVPLFSRLETEGGRRSTDNLADLEPAPA